MFFLSQDIVLALAKLLLLGLPLVRLVFNQHFFKVVALLLALLSLELAFGLHFFLETFNKLDFSAECIFLISSSLALLFLKLAVAAFLLLLSFDAGEILFLELTHSKQLDVLLLQLSVDVVLFFVGTGTISLLSHLLVELLAHQPTTLLLPQHRLLLLFVVQQLIEFLYCCPFVFFSNFTIDLS